MSNNLLNDTTRGFLGYSELSKTATRIEEFDSLFAEEPSSEFLLPVKMTKQTVSRKVFRPGFRTHNVGYFASRINQALVTFESSLEKHACTVFESYPEVVSYRTQPYGVRLYFHDKFRTVYPDFELVLNDGLALVDIRYEDNTHSPKFEARCTALNQYAQQRGIRYTVLTEKELMTHRKNNSRFLLSFCKGDPHPRLIQTTRTWLLNVIPLDFSEVLRLTTAYPSARAVIAGFILDGVLSIDWMKTIHDQILGKPESEIGGSWLD